MKKNYLRSLFLIGGLIAVTSVAVGYTSRENHFDAGPNIDISAKTGIVTLSGHLTQKKVLSGGDGAVTLSLTLQADEVFDLDKGDARHVDMVIVLDRSGSMKGNKIEDAKRAVLNLLSGLTAEDRLALVSYSNGVKRHSNH